MSRVMFPVLLALGSAIFLIGCEKQHEPTAPKVLAISPAVVLESPGSDYVKDCASIRAWSGSGKSAQVAWNELQKIEVACDNYLRNYPKGDKQSLVDAYKSELYHWNNYYRSGATPAAVTPELEKPKWIAKKGEHYRAYSLVSTKLNEEMSSKELEQNLFCKGPTENLEFSLNLMKKYDIVGTSGDYSMGVVSFSGVSDEKPVKVSIFTDHQEKVIKYIALGGDVILTCERNY